MEASDCVNEWHGAREYAGRSEAEVRDWIKERRDHEVRNAPTERNTPASGMTMGAIETLDALIAWLNGEDE